MLLLREISTHNEAVDASKSFSLVLRSKVCGVLAGFLGVTITNRCSYRRGGEMNLEKELTAENESNTPDFILAKYLTGCLAMC